MNILEEFWYGNIEPAEYDTSSSKEYKELLQLISRNEEKLLATMTDPQKELFTKYADCVREYQVMAECLLFQNSFRLGGRMMLEKKALSHNLVFPDAIRILGKQFLLLICHGCQQLVLVPADQLE